MAIAFKFK